MIAETEFLTEYVQLAPLPLAFERTLECRVMADQLWERPVLDVGCGDGIFAQVLFDEPIEVGLDPDPHELAGARRGGAYASLVEAWGDRIPFSEGSFRTVFANSVLEHIPDLAPVLAEVNRVLSDGGRFYVTLPTENFQRFSVVNVILTGLRLEALSERWQRFFNRFWRHHNVHTEGGWRELFEDAGFKVREHRTYDPRRVCLLNDALMPFSALTAVNRRVVHRWFLLPGRARWVLTAPARWFAARFLQGAERATPGGLIFFALEKSS